MKKALALLVAGAAALTATAASAYVYPVVFATRGDCQRAAAELRHERASNPVRFHFECFEDEQGWRLARERRWEG